MMECEQKHSLGASWCNLTDDVTTYPMMTSLCVIELIMVQGLSDVINISIFHYGVIIVKLRFLVCDYFQ